MTPYLMVNLSPVRPSFFMKSGVFATSKNFILNNFDAASFPLAYMAFTASKNVGCFGCSISVLSVSVTPASVSSTFLLPSTICSVVSSFFTGFSLGFTSSIGSSFFSLWLRISCHLSTSFCKRSMFALCSFCACIFSVTVFPPAGFCFCACLSSALRSESMEVATSFAMPVSPSVCSRSAFHAVFGSVWVYRGSPFSSCGMRERAGSVSGFGVLVGATC